MNIEIVKSILKSELIGRKIIYFEETDSTNNEVKRHADAKDGSVFIAEYQTAGKGRRGRIWESEAGAEILMSVLLMPNIPPEQIPALTAVAGLAVCRAIRSFGLDAGIKWPNDIVINGKKLCGILCEMFTMGESSKIAVGIGINANTKSFDGELESKATSIYLQTGKRISREELTAAVLLELDKCYANFLKNGFSSLLKEYSSLCLTLEKKVEIVTGNSSYFAKAVGITMNGELLAETENGIKIINSGEVSVRGIYGYV